MINRASVQLWGKAGQSAGPPKSAGKKSDTYRRSCGTDPILSTQRIPRGRDPILSTQRVPRGRDRILSTQRVPRGRDPILSTQTVYIVKFSSRCARLVVTIM